MSDYLRISQRDWPTAGQIDVAKDSHVFIRRHGIPIHPGPTQIVRLLWKDFDCQRIQTAGAHHILDVQFMNAECPSYLGRVGNLLTIKPDVRPEVNAIEM